MGKETKPPQPDNAERMHKCNNCGNMASVKDSSCNVCGRPLKDDATLYASNEEY